MKKSAASREKYKSLTPEAKKKLSIANREWRLRNARNIQQQRLSKYDLTIEQFDALLQEQGGACAICRSTKCGPKTWHVDHDHKTGVVRGLLCHHCNCGIGHLKDDPTLLLKAAEYLAKERRKCQ